MQPTTLDCPFCNAPVPFTKGDRMLACEGCGKRTDLDNYVASYELMLKWPEVFLKGMDDG
jgi:hypothetical protein